MYNETSHEQSSEHKSVNDLLDEHDRDIAAAEQELERAKENLRGEDYPSDPVERKREYSKRLRAVDDKKKHIEFLGIRRLEAEEEWHRSHNNESYG